MSTPYGGNDPQQQPQWGQQPQYGQQPGGAYPPSGPQEQPQWGQPAQPQQPEQPQWGQAPPQQPQQPQWGQQPGYPQQQPQQPYDPNQQQYGQPQQQPYDPSQPQQPQYGQQPGGAYPPSGPQQVQYGQQQPGQPGQPGQFDYGQPQYPGAPVEGESKGGSKKGLYFGIGGLVLVIAIVAVLGFVAPGFFKTEVFNNTQMQTDVQKVLTENYKIEGVTGVSCPAKQEVKDGATFNCTATVAGKQQQVPITVKGTGGDYQVAPPVTK